jgi:hypothetical protein
VERGMNRVQPTSPFLRVLILVFWSVWENIGQLLFLGSLRWKHCIIFCNIHSNITGLWVLHWSRVVKEYRSYSVSLAIKVWNCMMMNFYLLKCLFLLSNHSLPQQGNGTQLNKIYEKWNIIKISYYLLLKV